MNYHTLTVQHSGSATDSHPRIQIIGDWLEGIGFVDGALVQALPTPGELVFTLYDRNIDYSDLYNTTKEKGGTLSRVYIADSKTIKGLAFSTAGRHIGRCGFAFGDVLIAQCKYGCIRVRKVSGNVRLLNMAKAVDARTGKVTPKVYVFGDWLEEIGFASDTLVGVAADFGCITLTAYDREVVYSDIVRFARQNRMRLIQVGRRRASGVPLINAEGAWVKDAGFEVGDIFAACFEHGIIRLQRFDPSRFGFTDD